MGRDLRRASIQTAWLEGQFIRRPFGSIERPLNHQLRPLSGLVSRVGARLLVSGEPLVAGTALPLDVRAVQLADAIADVEYAVRTHETFKSAFARWLKLHIVLSAILYVLLAFHVWAAIHFGLRWFS